MKMNSTAALLAATLLLGSSIATWSACGPANQDHWGPYGEPPDGCVTSANDWTHGTCVNTTPPTPGYCGNAGPQWGPCYVGYPSYQNNTYYNAGSACSINAKPLQPGDPPYCGLASSSSTNVASGYSNGGTCGG